MCKQCVKTWAGTGKHFSGHLEEQFNGAIMRDMMTTDEEGMFYLFCYEQSICGFDDAMRVIMFDEMMAEIASVMGL